MNNFPFTDAGIQEKLNISYAEQMDKIDSEEPQEIETTNDSTPSEEKVIVEAIDQPPVEDGIVEAKIDPPHSDSDRQTDSPKELVKLDNADLSLLTNKLDHFMDDISSRMDTLSSQVFELQKKLHTLSSQVDSQLSKVILRQNDLYSRSRILEEEIQILKNESPSKRIAENQVALNTWQKRLISQISEIKSIIPDKFRDLPTLFSRVDTLTKQTAKLDEINQKVSDISYNMVSSSSSGRGNDDYVRRLQEQVVRLQDDAFLKMMRNYIIDTYVDLYSQISKRSLVLSGDSVDELKNLMNIIEEEMASIGINLRISPQGCKFNPSTMISNPNFSQTTSNQEEKYTVFTTITPAFIWTIPVEGRSDSEILLKKEEVAIYI